MRRRRDPQGSFWTGVLTSDELTALCDYNAERARGIMHTPEWQARMAELQDRFNAARDAMIAAAPNMRYVS